MFWIVLKTKPVSYIRSTPGGTDDPSSQILQHLMLISYNPLNYHLTEHRLHSCLGMQLLHKAQRVMTAATGGGKAACGCNFGKHPMSNDWNAFLVKSCDPQHFCCQHSLAEALYFTIKVALINYSEVLQHSWCTMWFSLYLQHRGQNPCFGTFWAPISPRRSLACFLMTIHNPC
jgi:hypothetical protein